jgi:hypothetical protein
MTHLTCAVGLAAALALLAPAARAQGVPNASRGFQPPVKQKNLPEYQPKTQPPALPGTLNLSGPAERTQLDLPPTESLFDAVNRGDIAAARDAINRGADLGGRNILGMTALDLSVDLARNDITFLLLSLRGGNGPTGPAPTAAAAAKAPPGKSATASAKTAPAKAAPKVATVAPARQAPPRQAPAPQQFAGPGGAGTPNPQAGFLGFGGGVQ